MRQMRVIAFMNLKGGTAKTTTTVNTAAILAHDHEKTVLVVDADSQGNTTEFLCSNPVNEASGLAALLRGGDCGFLPTGNDRIQLLAADDSLMDLDLSKAEGGELRMDCLRRISESCRDRFDFMLVDCPPAFNAAAAAALIAADEVIIPMKLDAFSLRGMANLMRQVANMRKINPALRVAGILPTMWYSNDAIKTAERELRLSDLPVFPHIRRSFAVDDMTFRQRPLIETSPRSGACRDYRRFVNRLIQGGETYV